MNSITLKKHVAGSRKQRGQGMTEYVIVVALIAIAAIGVYTRFGKTVKDEVAGVTAGLAGDAGNVSANQNKATQDEQQANSESAETLGMDKFGQDVKDQ